MNEYSNAGPIFIFSVHVFNAGFNKLVLACSESNTTVNDPSEVPFLLNICLPAVVVERAWLLLVNLIYSVDDYQYSCIPHINTSVSNCNLTSLYTIDLQLCICDALMHLLDPMDDGA